MATSANPFAVNNLTALSNISITLTTWYFDMSQLELHGRPWTVFKPDNQEHRAWYYNFVKTGAWGRCPVRFVIPDDHGNLITMIQRKLVEYYVTQEFKRTRKK